MYMSLVCKKNQLYINQVLIPCDITGYMAVAILTYWSQRVELGLRHSRMASLFRLSSSVDF